MTTNVPEPAGEGSDVFGHEQGGTDEFGQETGGTDEFGQESGDTDEFGQERGGTDEFGQESRRHRRLQPAASPDQTRRPGGSAYGATSASVSGPMPASLAVSSGVSPYRAASASGAV